MDGFQRSLGDESATRQLRVGSFLVPPFVMPCSIEKPITCPLPGATIDVLNLLASYYSTQLDVVDFPGAGLGFPKEGNGTVIRSLIDGALDVGVPHMWYVAERVTNLPNFSFPLSMGVLCTIMVGNSSLISTKQVDSLDVKSQGILWTMLLIIGLVVYCAHYFFERRSKDTSLPYSKYMLEFNIFLYSMIILLYLNFCSSTIAISLFQPIQKQLPFQTFDQLADAALSGKVGLVGVQASAPARFISPGEELAKTDSTLSKFYQANKEGKITSIETMDAAFDLIVRDDSRAVIANFLEIQRFPNLCDYEIITDLTFPHIPHGLFYSNASPAWFAPDASLIAHMGTFYEHYTKHYTNPTRCTKMIPRAALNIIQMATVFFLLVAGYILAFISFGFECYLTKFKRTRPAGKEKPSDPYKDYNIKEVVNSGDAVWVHFCRKSL